ncbi:MAG: glycosyltransferase [Candidatus Omnitrophica bacterium]|nr:glycosyltransferase [Candidatus Omnitrophota bacterium]
MNPLISVIIPFYNNVNYISQALDSVINQTYKNFEIIAVDDGSIDDTKYIVQKNIKKYPEKIKYLYQTNSGSAAARNKGIAEAKGELIAFLDSDDTWLPGNLARQTELLDKTPAVSLVHSDFIYFNDQGIERKSEYSKNIKKHFSGDIFYYLFRENFISTSTVVVRKDVFEKSGLFDEEFRMSQDYDLWLRITKKYKVGYVDTPLVRIRCHGNNITRSKEKTYVWVNKVIEKTIESFPEIEAELKSNLPYRLAKNHFTIGYEMFCKEDFKQARSEFCHSIRCKFTKRAFFYYILTFLNPSILSALRGLKRQVQQ